MIRDPGGSSPNENLDSPPSPKYDRIGVLGRPPPPLDDTEIPLDMTVRRKDSSDGQGSPPGGGDQSRDVPINLNVRPSVITKAPPPPIKKRISHMHTNGEIVLKSSVRTSSSSVVDSKPIVHVSSTYCDVSIEEHFRRSLGPTYSSIYGDKQQLQQQPSATALNVLNNNSSSSSTTVGLGSFAGLDPHQAHQVKHPLPVPLLLQKHPMETCETPPIAAINSIRVVAPDTIELKLSSDPAPPIPLMPATVLPPSPGAPSPAAGLVTMPTSNVAISLTSPKHQTVTAATAHLLQQHPPPPISPASMTTTGSLSSSSPSSSLASSPAPFLSLHPHQQQLKGNSIDSAGGEVDDHFAKALGDTWKKIQENKMNL
ncbi:AGAP012239-PA-like protein [Anopheles sinensis]|uniref:AGAP012239-PA-like protein n=1 Tax=Anopheles sinensis TaxID=74873 RepID=A0A084WB52_ANOSI|nr:AGAP012239-PA-like protein [Anopheles sinensis]